MEQYQRHFFTHFIFNKPFKTLLIVLSVALFALRTHAAEDVRLIAERYGADAARAMVTLSPNGELIAYYTRGAEEDMILVYSLKEKKNLTGVRAGDLDIQALRFISNQHLVLKAGEQKRIRFTRGGAGNNSSAYSLNVKTGEVKQLLSRGAKLGRGDGIIYQYQYGLGNIVGVSPDKKKLYMPAFVPRSKTDVAPDYTLLEVDIDDPRRPNVVGKGNDLTRDWFVNSHGEVVAQEMFSDTQEKHSIRVPDGRGWREIYSDELKSQENRAHSVAHFSGLTADESALVMLKTDLSTGRATYYTLNLETGKEQKLPLNRDDVDIEYIETDDNNIAMGVVYGGFNPGYHLFNEKLNKRLTQLQGQFPEHSVWLVSGDAEWEKLILYVSGQSIAGGYYISTPDQPLGLLMSRYPDINVDQVHPSATLKLKARDGLAIPTMITIPRAHAEAPTNLPAVIMPHGGPESYDRQAFDGLVQAMAASGYVVIQPQFRGSSGFGYELWEAGLGEWGRAMQDDVSDAVIQLGKAGIIDASKVCIVGTSYGGYAALAGATFTPSLYRCAVSIHGVSDLNAMIEYEKGDHGEDSWVINYFSRSMARDYFTPERLAAHSPANFASGVQAPVLLIHGEDDKTVPIEQSRLMHEKLKAANKSVRFIELEDTGHSHGRDETVRIPLYTEILQFLNQHLITEEQG